MQIARVTRVGNLSLMFRTLYGVEVKYKRALLGNYLNVYSCMQMMLSKYSDHLKP